MAIADILTQTKHVAAARRPLRVCHVSLTLKTGGLERILADLARHHHRENCQPEFLAIRDVGRFADEIRDAGGIVHRLNPGGRWSQITQMRRLFREQGYDVVHTHNTYPHIYGSIAARLAKVPVVVNTRHGQRAGHGWKSRTQFRWASHLVDRIIAVSDDAAQLCVDADRVAKRKVQRIWNGIDLADFAFSGPILQPIAISVARLSAEKDFPTLIRAVPLVIAAVPDFRLKIVGDGPERERLESLTRELGMTRHIELMGERTDVPELLREAGFFVSSSLTEGISLTLLEAMAVGLPIVATAVGGNPEIVVPGKTGHLVPSNDPQALADSIVRLCRDSSSWQEMGRAARDRVSLNFDVRRMARDYEQLYAELAKRSRVNKDERLQAFTNLGSQLHTDTIDRTRMYDKLYRHLLLPFFDGVVKRRQTVAHWRRAEESQWWSREQLEEFQLSSLRQLLTHAATTCPYFGELWTAQGLEINSLQTIADFQRWPLMTRETIRQNRLRMRTTANVQRMSKATGGSSGEPLQFDLDSGSNDRRTALMWRGYSWAGAAPGTRQLYVWGTATGKIPVWKRWKKELHLRFDNHLVLSCFEFTPTKMRQHFERMNQYRADVIVAYTTPLYEFARYIDGEGLKPVSPKSIIVGAEKLHAFQRELIERVFQAPVFETYGSREFMLIGAECEKHSGLHLSLENLLVEVLDDNGHPTPRGEEGNVVVTDLFNYGMPFIRYVNGDRAVAGFDQCSCGRGLPLLKQVVGRQLDTLDTPDGRKIPGEFFPHLIKDFPAIRRFQVVQETVEQITLKLVVDGGNLAPIDRETLLGEIRKCTGTTVDVRLQVVDDIPLTKAGKLKVVVHAV